MPVPCTQAETIGGIKAALESLDERAERHEQREERILGALENVAAQGKSIEYLLMEVKEHKDYTQKVFQEAFKRLRTLEAPPPKPPAIQLLESAVGPYIVGLIFLTAGVTVVADFEVVKTFYKLFKG